MIIFYTLYKLKSLNLLKLALVIILNQIQDLSLRAYIKNAMPFGLPPLGNLTGSEHKAKEILFDYEKNMSYIRRVDEGLYNKLRLKEIEEWQR